MRILIVSIFFPPLNSIASLRPYSWAKYWSSIGHDVTVLTTAKQKGHLTDLHLPNNGFNLIEIPYPEFFRSVKKEYQSVIRPQAHLTLTPSPWKQRLKRCLFSLFDTIRHKRGIFNGCRMPDFADLWIIPALKAVKGYPPWDLVISTAGPYTVHIVGSRLKKRGLARRWIADYRDTWSDNYIYPGIFPFSIFEAFLEKKLLRHADAITTISQQFADRFHAKYPQVHAFAIENGFDPGDLASLDPAMVFPSDGKYRIVHTGTIYAGKRDPSPLLKAIALIKEQPGQHALLDHLEVLFVGPNQANVGALIRQYGVEKWVKMLGTIPRQEALRMQRDAHRLLFLPWNDSSVDGVITGKLYEYLFSKTPILAVGSPTIEASQKLILEAKAGVAFHSPEAVAHFLIEELKSPTAIKNQLDPNLLKRYNREVLALKILECIDEQISTDQRSHHRYTQ